MTGAEALAAFAADVGPLGPVAVAGGRTRWAVGGGLDARARVLAAPAGIVAVEPEELTVRVRAGTTVDELADALADVGQRVLLPDPGPGATVGGVLAVGESDVRRLGHGPLRDSLLEATFVSAEGHLVRAGGPTVKNVSGFDLCRVLVGSLGTIGLLAEVVLRTRPVPAATAWWSGAADPFALRRSLHRPSALLWDGSAVWVLLEGHAIDVEAEGVVCREAGLSPVERGPVLPPHRWSLDPSALRDGADLARRGGGFVAEIGVGTVHAEREVPPPPLPERLAALHRGVKRRFDPTERLNPGREVLPV